MRRQRATIADHLSQVIEVIELGRRTGLLSVERTDQAGLEEGDIYFVQGEAIYACTGTKSGRVALDILRTWGACRFAFLANIPKPPPNIGPEIRGSRPSQTGALPAIDRASHPPLTSPQRPGSPSFGPPTNPYQHAVRGGPAGRGPSGYSLPRAPQSPEGWPPSGPPSRPLETSPLPGLTPNQRPKCGPNPQDIPRLAASYQLSLAQRSILLLASGEHTVAELAHLSRRSQEEVVRLLTELLRMGLITMLS